MRYGIIVNAGDPREMADIAAEAEGAGWDGVFYFDAMAIGDMDLYDPWIVLASMAMRTDRVRLGLVTSPPSRRRPWKLARETMTIAVRPYAEAGATWWIDANWAEATVESVRRRARAGPPRA